MAMIEWIYTGGLHALRAALPLLARGEGKLARGIRGRAGVLERMRTWAAEHRDEDRQLVWFHAPSVGEGLQAAAVMHELRMRRPDLQIVYTFFSPSAEGLARRVDADFADYLPLDTPGEIDEALELLRPQLIAFSKTDVWPNLTRRAARRKVKLAMISGTLPASSSRMRGPARLLLQPAYARLDHVAAISQEHAARFGALGVPDERRSVMGDAHFDRVLSRADSVDRTSPLLKMLAREEPVLVAGSTWSADEERLLPAVVKLREQGLPLRLVLVPHEPTEAHLVESEQRMDALGLPHLRLGRTSGEWRGDEVVLVDRVGVLGEIYSVAAAAYVGGGFGTAGLHSVLEPAAFGVPVLFGPRHSNASEAGELIAAGGAAEVANSSELADRLSSWLREGAGGGLRAGAAARAYVESGRGAAARGAALIERLLSEAEARSARPPSSRAAAPPHRTGR